MGQYLQQLIIAYCTRPQKEVLDNLASIPSAVLRKVLIDLLTIYYNDLNSSAMRELAVILLRGYEPRTQKLGYNGYKMNAPGRGVTHCEVKPKNSRSEIISANKGKRRLNGGGNYTDFTWERFDRYSQDNPNILTAGFVDGRLIYICEFPFHTPRFISHLEESLEKFYPNRVRNPGSYQRSVEFTFKHFKNAENLIVDCYVSRTTMLELEAHMQVGFRKWLQEHCNE
ncbi:MAG: hypothetical protein OXF22_06730 [Anaerolineaceae bacterium]|nr:hypothetical protein [Anaerolineaceae bacterium]